MELVGEAGSSPIIFTPAFWRAWHLPIILFYFIFTRCIPTPWIFDFYGLSAVPDLESLSRDSILRVLYMFQYLQRFWRRLQNCRQNWSPIYMWAAEVSPPILLGVSALVSGLWNSNWSSGGVLVVLLYLIISAWKGLQISRKDCFAIARDVLVSLLPDFCFCHFAMEKVSMRFSSYLWRDLFCSLLSSCSTKNRKFNIVHRKIVSTVLRVFNYRLNLSFSDFAKWRTL